MSAVEMRKGIGRLIGQEKIRASVATFLSKYFLSKDKNLAEYCLTHLYNANIV